MIHRIRLSLSPKTDAHIPYSDGYLAYSAVLGELSQRDEEVSETVHDSDGKIHISGLDGSFSRSRRRHQKKIRQSETYKLRIGLFGSHDSEYETALRSFAFDSEAVLTIGDGEFAVESVEVDSTTFAELLKSASVSESRTIDIEFVTPTCIQGASGTEMFPHRGAVFGSILSTWNKFAPEESQLGMSRADIEDVLYELPTFDSLQSHNPVIAYGGETRTPIKRHGFTGKCAYRFDTDTSEARQTAIRAMAAFAEYSGIGSAVARGCGSVRINFR